MVRKEHAAPYGMQLDSGFDGTDLWKSSFPDVSRPLFAPWGYLKPNPQQQWRGGKQRAAVVMTASTAAADSTKQCVLINTKVIPALEALRRCPALTLCRGGKFRGLCSVGGGFQHTLLLPGGSCSWAEHWELHFTAGKRAAPTQEDCRVQRKHQEQKCGGQGWETEK